MMGSITSTSNATVRRIREYRKVRERRAAGVAVAEGIKVVTELSALGDRVVEVCMADSLHGRPEGGYLLERFDEYETLIHRVSDRVLAHMADTKTPQGVLAVVRTAPADAETLFAGPGDLLVLDGVQDPGNVGTLIRTAEAAGLAGVVLTEGCADPTGAKCVRAAAGSLFRLPYVLWGGPPDALAEQLEEAGCTVCAAVKAGAVTPDQAVRQGGRVAWVLGAEGTGVSVSLADRATLKVSIPMVGQVESLGVAAAGAILMYTRVG